MIKVIVIWLLYLFLLIPAFSNNQLKVDLFLTPFSSPVNLPLSVVILGAATLGIVVTIGLGLLDRAQLNTHNRKLVKELDQLRKEIHALRELATLEREPE